MHARLMLAQLLETNASSVWEELIALCVKVIVRLHLGVASVMWLHIFSAIMKAYCFVLRAR